MDSEGPPPLHSTADDDQDDGGEGIAGWVGDDADGDDAADGDGADDDE